MSDTAQKWLMGCGIGCAVVILLGALLFGGCYYCARHVSRGFDQASKSQSELETRFGPIRSYTPPLDGVVAPARMEAFLAVRDSIAPMRKGIEDAFASFARAEKMGRKKDFRTILDAVRGGFSMGPLTGEFYDKRNAALLAHDMGLGEYTYIYCLAYFSYLGLEPEAGLRGLRYDDEESGYGLRSRINRRMREELGNLQKALDAQASGAAVPKGSFREALNNEVAALLTDDRRLPWPGSLPPGIAAGFAPYRERLQSTYSAATNFFEFGSNIRSRRGTFTLGSGDADSSGGL